MNLLKYGLKYMSLMYPGCTYTSVGENILIAQRVESNDVLRELFLYKPTMVVLLLPKSFKFSVTRADYLRNPNISEMYECLIIQED